MKTLSTLSLVIMMTFCLVSKNSAAQGYIQKSFYSGGNENDYHATRFQVGQFKYLAYNTQSTNLPVKGHNTSYSGSGAVYIAKTDSADQLIKSTYLSSNGTSLYDVQVEGNFIYVFGVIRGALSLPNPKGTYNQGSDYLVVKLDTNLNIIYSSVFGADENEEFYANVFVKNGEAYILGSTYGADYPVTNSSSYADNADFVFTVLDTTGDIRFSTYIGSSGYETTEDFTPSITLYGGFVYISGYTDGKDFPDTEGTTFVQDASNLFIQKYKTDGTLVLSKCVSTVAVLQDAYYLVKLLSTDDGLICITNTSRTGGIASTDGSVAVGNKGSILLLRYDVDLNISHVKYLSDVNLEIYPITYKLDSVYWNSSSTEQFILLPVTCEGAPSVFKNTDNINAPTSVAAGFRLILLKLDVADLTIKKSTALDCAPSEPGIIQLRSKSIAIYSRTIGTTTDGTVKGLSRDEESLIVLDSNLTLSYATYVYAEGRFITESGKNVVEILGNANSGATKSLTITEGGGKGQSDISITRWNICPDFPTNNVLSPSSQTSCINGYAETIFGNKVNISPDSMPTVYDKGVPRKQNEISARYQWQVADNGSGPWGDIPGAVQKDYTPIAGNASKYFRRIAKTYLHCGSEIISTSNVSSLLINSNTAPVVDAGENFNSCPGNSITLGGSPSASGGTSPYTYSWDKGLSSVSNPSATPTESTVYTLTVTDNNGCTQKAQAVITVYSADAGPAYASNCDGDSVRIGGKPVAGLTGVSYAWSPSTGLSSSTTLSPMALTSNEQKYVLTLTIPLKAGGTCQSKDSITVSAVSKPNISNFAGADKIICVGETAGFGTNPSASDTTLVPYQRVNQTTIDTYTGTVSNLTDLTFTTGARTQTGTNQAVIFSFDKVVEFNLIKLAAISKPNLYERVVQVSIDSIIWTPVRTIYSVASSQIRSLIFSNNIEAKYIRVIIPTGRVDISEFFVYNTFKYTWAPGNYLTSNVDPTTTYNPGGNIYFPPTPDSAIYTLTASKQGCYFTDEVVVSVIRAYADLDACGPRLLGAPDLTPDLNETYSWKWVSGDGYFIGDSNIAQPIVRATTSGVTKYALATNYRNHTCVDTVLVPPCGCVANIQAISEYGCPSTLFSNDVTLLAFPQGDTAHYTYSWSPTAGLDNYNSRRVKLTDNVSRTYTVTVTSIYDASYSCSGTILTSSPSWSLPTFNAKDVNICAGEAVSIGQTYVSGYSYKWTGQDFNSNSSNPSVTVDKTSEFFVTVTDDASGCKTFDTAHVSVRGAQAKAGPDITVCSNSTIQIGTPSEPNKKYVWTPSANWQNSTDSSAAQPYIFVATNQTMYLKLVDTIAGCISLDTINIILNNTPSIQGSRDTFVCLGKDVVFGNPALPGVTYSWSPSTGLNSASLAQPTATPTSTTQYIATLSFPGTCTTNPKDTVIVTVVDNSFTLTDTTYCPSSGAISIGGGAPVNMASYSWSPSAMVSNATLRNPVANPSSKTEYTLSVVDNSGCEWSDKKTVDLNVDKPIAGNNRVMCLGTSEKLGDPSNTGTITWTGKNGTSTLSCTNCAEPNFTPDAVGTYRFAITSVISGCTVQDSVLITVINFEVENITTPPVCQNTCIEIGPSPTSGTSYFWTPSSGLSNDRIARPTVCPSASTNYTLTAVGANGCVDTKSVPVILADTTAPSITIPDVSLCVGQQSVTLSPVITPSNGNYNYKWSPPNGVSNIYAKNPSVNPGNVGIHFYTLEVTDFVTGCQNAGEAKVTVELCQLPVDLLFINSTWDVNNAIITWSTASELNNEKFELFRSVDGQEYQFVNAVYSKATFGTSNEILEYSYSDYGIKYDIDKNVCYYIKQIDLDGQSEDFGPTCLEKKSSSNLITNVYPVPTKDEVYLETNEVLAMDYKLEVIDLAGRIIEIDHSKINDFKVLIPVTALNNGVYFLRIENNKTSQMKRFVISR